VILDFWGLWCPACRDEIPFLREAYKRFKNRNFEIIGMNTDDFAPEQIKQALEKGEINWTQARLESIFDLINVNLRIESFPSTFLVAPDGKILSMSRTARDEADLRGADLLDTLDKILPKK
jgi:thiol-disulfide isomerase/thioredoxin